MLRGLMASAALLATGSAFIAIFNPPAAVLFLSILTSPLFMNTRPPPMFENDVADSWLKSVESGKRLTAHLQAEFPSGTPAAMLTATLLKQGFEPFPDCVRDGHIVVRLGEIHAPCRTSETANVHFYRWGNPACVQTIDVTWKSDDAGAITEVTASHHDACL
ncbi:MULTISPECIES: hypothetical protein [unclassified Bradyrhizobium]|uniref:hypothetical protein n=2 Tax=Nitrobacteraceae TaxID=41294 RepID=UPI0028EA5E97|nr:MULTISPECIES: hypothetical protein [unclassified Bradyrhizobium]